jgi:hypothetical protein
MSQLDSPLDKARKGGCIDARGWDVNPFQQGCTIENCFNQGRLKISGPIQDLRLGEFRREGLAIAYRGNMDTRGSCAGDFEQVGPCRGRKKNDDPASQEELPDSCNRQLASAFWRFDRHDIADSMAYKRSTNW